MIEISIEQSPKVKKLFTFCYQCLDLKGELPNLANDLKANPELHLKAISVAFHQVSYFDQYIYMCKIMLLSKVVICMLTTKLSW